MHSIQNSKGEKHNPAPMPTLSQSSLENHEAEDTG